MRTNQDFLSIIFQKLAKAFLRFEIFIVALTCVLPSGYSKSTLTASTIFGSTAFALERIGLYLLLNLEKSNLGNSFKIGYLVARKKQK
jgi:hypothetical protein